MNFPIEKNKNIVVIGDIMLDRFYYGKLEDTSKEDPLAKILKVQDSSENLGGAGNVALNIKTMLSNAFLLGVVGKDDPAAKIKALSREASINIEGIFQDPLRPTTLKSRLYDGDQVIRFDQEVTTEISKELQSEILDHLIDLINTNGIDGIILQDYNKGVLSSWLIGKIISLANENNIPTYVDPKRDNFFEYKNVTIFKPNEREINWSLPQMNYKKAALEILNQLNPEFAVITLAEKGMYLFSEKDTMLSPARADKIVDVCGAGDTVISILALTHNSKCNMNQMAQLANLAAAQVCQYRGVKPINYEDLQELYASLCEDKDIIDIS